MFACWTHWKVCGMCVTLSSTQFAACGWVSGSLGWSCMTTRDSSCGRATGRCKNWVWRWARSAGWRRPWPPKRWRSTETECLKKKSNQWAIALVPQFCPHWWLFVYIPGEEEESKQPLDCTTFVLLRLRFQSKENYAHTVHMGTSGVQCTVGYKHSDKLSCFALFKAAFRCLP